MVLQDPREAFIVEFVDSNGDTIDTPIVEVSDVTRVRM
jgi:hypothetical protein